jgi:hypothetical protein
MRIRSLAFVVAAVTPILLASSAASAEEVMKEIKIVAKPARPLVTELAIPSKTLDQAKIKLPVAQKIVEATASDPF